MTRSRIFCFALIQLGYWGYYATFCGYITALLVENGISNTGLSAAVFGYQACAFAGSILLGRICDRVQSNKKPVLILSLLAMMLSILLSRFSADNRVVAFTYVMIGLTFGPMISCVDAWILHMFPGDGSLYGRMRAIGSFTLAGGMLLQGQMIERCGYGIMIRGGMITIAIVLAAGLALPDVARTEHRAAGNSSQDLKTLLRNSNYRSLLMILFLVGMAVAPVNNLKVSIIRNLGGNVGWFGADNFFGIAMQVPLLLLAGKICRLSLKIRYALLGILPCGMLLLDLLAVHPLMVILGTCINNIAYAVQLPTMREVTETYVNREQKNLGHNLMDAVYGCMAGMISAVYAGVVIDLAGMKMLFSVCMVIQAAASILVVRYCLKKDKT